MKYTQYQITEQYKKLPKDLQDSYFSTDPDEVILKIGQKYGLTVDKIGELASETGLTLLGLTSTKDFIPHLKERLGVTSEVANKIGFDINEQVFAEVRESMKKIHGFDGVEPVAEEEKQAIQEVAAKVLEQGKEEILKELRESEIHVPNVFKGSNVPVEHAVSEYEMKPASEVPKPPPPPVLPPLGMTANPLEAKTTGDVFRIPKEETVTPVAKEYPRGSDPYREEIG